MEKKKAAMKIGMARRMKFCPPARMTIISLELERRPKAMSDPKRTDMGKVTTMIDGMARTKTRKAAQAEAPYWLMRLAIR